MTIVGTRPEVIKMAPVVQALAARKHDFDQVVVATAQHRELLDQTLVAFGIEPDIDLNLMNQNHRLDEFAASALVAVGNLLDELQPDIVLVQGDTTTVMVAALAAFYRNIAVGHVEAGLRSHAMRSPFPEELNRRVAALAATYHFAPTERAKNNLIREGVPDENIHVTGNTVVDALQTMQLAGDFADPGLAELDFDSMRTILVTAHRRESHGPPLEAIFRALRTLTEVFDDVQFVIPVHLNPNVQAAAFKQLEGVERAHLVAPLSYADLLRAMSRSTFIMTDSGGMQEEAPSLGKQVLVLRDVTERPEVIESGWGELVGTDCDAIVLAASRLLNAGVSRMRSSAPANPFGDGKAGERIANVLASERSQWARGLEAV